MNKQYMTARQRLAGGLLVCAGWLLAFSSHAQTAIESVTTAIEGGVEVVRVELSQPLAAAPTGFAVQNPARIALDFPGVTNAMGRSKVEANQGNLRTVSVGQAGDRSRVVLNLKQATGYKTQLQGKTLLVLLDPVMSTAPAASSAPTFAEGRNTAILPLKDVDFRRGPDGSGRVIVELANSQVGVDIRQQGRTLVVDLLKTSLPEGLRRTLDVTDFATPVQTVTTTQTGDRVRMVIEPRGAWEHSAYQSDNQLVVEIHAQKVDTSKQAKAAGPGYKGEKLSLNFQNIEVRSLLQVIADFTNFNIVTSDSVSGSVTLRLKDVPWDQALDIVLQAKGLDKRKNGNVIWIAPKDEIAAKEKQDLESKATVQELEPLRTQSFQLNYTKATDIATQLGGKSQMLSPRGSMIAEARTNQLFVTDVPSKLEAMEALLAKLDIPVRQVLIEARIVEASDTFGRSLGVRLGGGFVAGPGMTNNPGGSVNGDVGNRTVLGAFGGSYTAGSSGAQGTNFVTLPAVGQGGYNPASFAISLFNASANRFLNLEISALEADGKGKIVSSPRVVTADQVKALIEQGTEYPYQKATSSGATAIEFKKANLKLEVTPQITPEGNVILDVDVTKDSRGESTSQGIAINTKHVKTQVLVENGGTVVIGGIFEQVEADTVTKVPLLGDIPLLGALFRTNSKIANKQETLVFITPKVLAETPVASN